MGYKPDSHSTKLGVYTDMQCRVHFVDDLIAYDWLEFIKELKAFKFLLKNHSQLKMRLCDNCCYEILDSGFTNC